MSFYNFLVAVFGFNIKANMLKISAHFVRNCTNLRCSLRINLRFDFEIFCGESMDGLLSCCFV